VDSSEVPVEGCILTCKDIQLDVLYERVLGPAESSMLFLSLLYEQ
jgi:hypothetical protein